MFLAGTGSTAPESSSASSRARRTHPGPVLDRLPDVGECPLDVVADSGDRGVAAEHGTDLHVHPALDHLAGAGLVRFDVRSGLDQRAQGFPADDHLRVYEQVQVELPGR